MFRVYEAIRDAFVSTWGKIVEFVGPYAGVLIFLGLALWVALSIR